MVECDLQLSALGRNVRVGDFYDYYTGAVFKSEIVGVVGVVPDQDMQISLKNQTAFSFFCQQPIDSKHQILGINSHVQRCIDEETRQGSTQPWCFHYLNISLKAGNDDEAQVTAFFRVERRTETLNCDSRGSRMRDYKLKCGGLATHLVEKVVYGAELICSFHRPLQGETKESAQLNLYLSAKNYFDQIINQSTSVDIPSELNEVYCTIFSSLDAGKPTEKSFKDFNQYLKEIRSSDGDCRSTNWKPIHLFGFCIPEQLKTRIELDRETDFASELEQHNLKWGSIEKEIQNISKHPCINRFRLLGKVMSDFQQVQPGFRMKIDKKIENEEYGKRHTEGALKQMRSISKFLDDVMDWLANRRYEIEEFSRLTSGTELAALDSEETKNYEAKKDTKNFELTVEYKEDPVMSYMRKEIGDQISIAELPVVQIFSVQKGTQSVRIEFEKFVDEARSNNSHGDTIYYIQLILVPSTIDDGTVRTHNNLGQSSEMPKDSFSSPSKPSSCIPTIESNSNQQHHMENERSPPDNDEQHETSQDDDYDTPPGSPSASRTTQDKNETQFFKNVGTKPSQGKTLSSTTNIDNKDPTATSTKNSLANQFNGMSLDDKKSVGWSSVADNIDKSANKSTSVKRRSTFGESQDDANLGIGSLAYKKTKKASQHDGKKAAAIHNAKDKRDDEIQESNGDKNSKWPVHETTDISEGRRIADIFVDKNTQYSELIKEGPPDIYMLNASQKSNGVDIKWFDIGRPGHTLQLPDPKNHKIIILMGATGSGKSTLINGMINYILGVQWNDPFRFKCVRDEGNGKSQAHSQTSTVTAYTLHHQKGMAIPYSITIIDTPGYGDTDGVKKDKEITTKIHRFLTQQEIPIDEIHAACFVAASGDSRLTYAQRYIIDSVLSIFGKDMKENLRLLVTFADNADPPVVEACKLANFPSTSASDDITYSKFNSAVLYCSNAIQENEFSFDELFWDMGQENFDKFFKMLADMGGQSLTATREVIQRRQQLGQSLKDIENELESFLVKIEKIEKHRRNLMKYGHNMETNKNFVQEKTEMRKITVDCDSGFMAYNCKICERTCEMPAICKNFCNRRCTDGLCVCPASYHEFQSFAWTLVTAKVKTTRNDMKTKFELNANQKSITEALMENFLYDLDIAKTEVLSLLEHLGAHASSLDSTALRSNAINPTEYLSLMRSRIVEEQAPGHEIRLQTLTDLQQRLNASDKGSTETGQPLDSNVANQPVKSANTSRGRGAFSRTSATNTTGSFQSKPGHPVKTGWDDMHPGPSQNCYPDASTAERTAPTTTRPNSYSNGEPSGNDRHGIASKAISTNRTYGQSRGRGKGRGGPSKLPGQAVGAIHGTGAQLPNPQSNSEDSDLSCVATSEPTDSDTHPSYQLLAKPSKDGEPKEISLLNQPGDGQETYSFGNDVKEHNENRITEKKSEGQVKKFINKYILKRD